MPNVSFLHFLMRNCPFTVLFSWPFPKGPALVNNLVVPGIFSTFKPKLIPNVSFLHLLMRDYPFTVLFSWPFPKGAAFRYQFGRSWYFLALFKPRLIPNVSFLHLLMRNYPFTVLFSWPFPKGPAFVSTIWLFLVFFSTFTKTNSHVSFLHFLIRKHCPKSQLCPFCTFWVL